MEKMSVFPEEVSKVELPTTVANDKAYYAATMYGSNPVEEYKTAKYDLATSGESSLISAAEKAWGKEQDTSTKQVISDLMADQTIDKEYKQSVLLSYISGGGITQGLREKYKQTIAAKDTAVTEADRASQDLWISTMQQRDQKGKEVQDEINKFGSSLSSEAVHGYGGIIRDFFPGAWNASVGKTTLETSGSWYEAAKGFLFVGSANADIRREYEGLPVERKKEFVQKIVESYKNSPGFDYNKWMDFQDQIEGDEHGTIITSLNNVASVFNIIGLGWILKNPMKAFKHLTTMEKVGVAPKVNPMSPLGTTAVASPQAASKMGAAVVADTTGEFASALGTTKGEVVSDWLLPKLDKAVVSIYPDIAKDTAYLDNVMQGIYQESKFDPFLLPVTQKEKDITTYSKVLEENKKVGYRQASSFLEETTRKIEGSAIYGKNEYGFDTELAASMAEKQIQENIKHLLNVEGSTTKIIKTDEGYFVKWDYKKDYDPFEHLVFGDSSVGFKFKVPLYGNKEIGLNLDGIARSVLGRWLPPTMRMDWWVPVGSARAEMRAAAVENEFIREIRSNVSSTAHRTELYNILRESEENMKWFSPQEVSAKYPSLSTSQHKELYRAYSYYRRIVDYEYNWANRYDKSIKAEKGHQAIYSGNKLLGYGTEKINRADFDDADVVWDFSLNRAVNKPLDLSSYKIVRVENNIEDVNGAIHEFGILREGTELKPLPFFTLPKLEVYIPRKNIENYYIKKTPIKAIINGKHITDPEKLRNFQKVIAAADTEVEANKLKNSLQLEYPDFTIEVRQEKGNTADAILTDYKVYKDIFENSKRRGDRLPTIDGFARLEDPLTSLMSTLKRTIRLDAYKDYTDAFRTNWMRAFNNFTRTNEFPSTLGEFRAPEGATKQEIQRYKVAQRLWEAYTNQANKTTYGDELWRDFFYNVSEVLEKLPFKLPHQLTKQLSKEGNLLVKIPKTVASRLFIDYNVPRQWLVQPQQLLELGIIDKQMATAIAQQLPSVIVALLSKAKAVGGHLDPIVENLHIAAGIPKEEFTAIVNAIHKSGILQSVDMNQVFHGTFQDVNRALVESVGRKTWEGVKQIEKVPRGIAKVSGYTSAELTNQLGAWLATRARWIKNHPDKDWNLPEHIEQISGEQWDITHSMSTRAGALPFQEGALSVLMQFAAVQHKAFFQFFSSKTLTAGERARLGAARMALYGMYGVPGAAGIDWLVQKYAEVGTKEQWNVWKRGLADWTINNMAHALLGEDDLNKTDVSIAYSASPYPATLPYLDFIIELSKFSKDSNKNPRFAGVQAVGSIYEAASDISDLFSAKELNTELALEIAGRQVLEMASGYNNFAKAMMIRNMGDKVNKLGNPLGLNLTTTEMVFQLFGVTSEKELAQYAAKDAQFSREQFIKQHAKSIHYSLMNMRKEFGQEKAIEYVDRLHTMSAFIDEDIRDDVEKAVYALDKQSLLTTNESLLLYILKHKKEKNDRYIEQMEAHLGASENPQYKEMQNTLQKMGVTK